MNRTRGLRFFFPSSLLALGAVAGACSDFSGPGGQPGGVIPPSIVHPVFPPTTTQKSSPPPISGGTLLIAKNGEAVAADSDRDAVYIVDLASRAVTTIKLQPGDEPGRIVEDDGGRAYVALRSGGALATIDLTSNTLIDRRAVCATPRGVAYDSADASLYVACESGELVQLPAGSGAPIRTLRLDRDLRDVIVLPDHLLVTRFRAAETLAVAKKGGTITNRWTAFDGSDGRTASVAWRTVADPVSAAIVMLHQRGAGSTSTPVATTPGGYGGPPPNTGVPCAKSIVETALSFFPNSDAGTGLQSPVQVQGSTTLPLSGAVVPVDLAVAPDRKQVAIAAPGNAFTPGAQTILVFDWAKLLPFGEAACIFPNVTPQPAGQPVGVAFTAGPSSQLVVQTREPATLFLPSTLTTIRLSNESREDTGHDVFHSNSGGSIACASCHPEGGDDGRVWTFDKLGARRTPSLRGTVEGTAPYHWGGEMQDFPTLVADVFQSRMSGPALADDQTSALSGWINRIPAPIAPSAVDQASADRGKALFDGPANCHSCHGGAKLTNNQTVDVGTGQAFQVPSLLGVAYRAPFMHDGCASTLDKRFDPQCGGGDQHGAVLNLSDQDRADIVAYLETL